MAKWNYVFLIEWLFISMVLHYGCPENVDINRNVCLKTALEFAWSWDACQFTLRKAQAAFQTETSTCSKKCNVRIDSLEALPGSNTYESWYQLTYSTLRFDGFSQNFKTINPKCVNYIYQHEKRTLEIICKTDFEILTPPKDLCTSPTECKDLSKECLRLTEKIGICVCRSQYIASGNECLEGNLTLYSTCQRSEQCSGTVGAICHNQKCVCRPGYIPLNASICFSADISDGLCTAHRECRDESKSCSMTGQVGICTCKSGFIGFRNDCLKGNLSLNESCQRNEQCSMVLGSVCQNNRCVLPPNGNFQVSAQDKKEDSVVGLMVGAVIGGLFLGIVLTVVGFIIFKTITKGKPKAGKEEDQTAVVFNKTCYETDREADQKHSTVQGTNEKKIVNVPPFAHSVDLPVTKNARTHHGNKSSIMKSYDVNDDVYNHLHEKDEDSENDETYDHAHGNISGAMEDSDYSNLNTVIRYKEPDVTAAEDNDNDECEPPGDYCALKKQ